MSYGPEEFATFYYEDFKLRTEVTAALLKRPNWGYTVEELNDMLGRDPSETAIEGIRRVLRELGDLDLIEIASRKNPRGPPTKIYKPGKLLDSYRDPILPSVFGKGREEFQDFRLDAILVKDSEKISLPEREPIDLTLPGIGYKRVWLIPPSGPDNEDI